MTRICVNSFSVSSDGFGAGSDQDVENPLGVGGRQLHEWIFATKSGRAMIGEPGGEEGIDDGRFRRIFDVTGPVIMGRHMFGPDRGRWGSPEWQGWWGENPPFHHPVFVLTHFERRDLVLGDTTFHFVTTGVDEALRRARDVADNGVVYVGGGVSTIRQLLDARLIDELHLALVPVALGSGERLLDGPGVWPEGYQVRSEVPGERVVHVELVRVDDVP